MKPARHRSEQDLGRLDEPAEQSPQRSTIQDQKAEHTEASRSDGGFRGPWRATEETPPLKIKNRACVAVTAMGERDVAEHLDGA